MSFGTAVLRIAIAVALIGALFGALAWRLGAARRPGRLLVSWAIAAMALGCMGAFRLVRIQQQLGIANARSQSVLLAGLFSAFIGIALAPSTIALRVRARRLPESQLARVAFSSGAWALLGLLLAVIVGLAVDLSNVPFVPLPGGH
jgi:uncharacterized protein YacL